MLENLHVKNLALIEEEEIEFGPGFNILTGETGAGKSIVLGSVNLALGAKLTSDVIRSGADSALIELTFSLRDDEALLIREMGYDLPDNSILLQRKIQPGKSICRINGETISQSQLKQIADILLEMYGQHDHQSLLKSATYEKMLDEYAGDEVVALQKELKFLRTKYKEMVSELEDTDVDASVRKRQADLLEYEINEISEASLKMGEDEELEKRYRFLNNAQKIKEAVVNTHSLTGYDDEICAGRVIGSALSALKAVSSLDDTAGELTMQLTEIEELLNDFNRSIKGYEDDLEFDEEEYSVITERLNLINNLKSKYGNSIEDILETLEDKESELLKINNYDEYLGKLKADIELTYSSMKDKCKKISDIRKKASTPLSQKLIEAMKDLNFQDVRLEIRITSDEEKIRDSGYDSIEFFISLNVGEELRPMQSVASGGELSRIMLAIKSVFASRDLVGSLIFDEIDSGISGRTAFKVAEKMNELSKEHQVICITHLPQIAAMADSHFLIEKNVSEGRTLTNIISLDEDESVKELARMLGGDSIDDAAIENARVLKSKK